MASFTGFVVFGKNAQNEVVEQNNNQTEKKENTNNLEQKSAKLAFGGVVQTLVIKKMSNIKIDSLIAIPVKYVEKKYSELPEDWKTKIKEKDLPGVFITLQIRKVSNTSDPANKKEDFTHKLVENFKKAAETAISQIKQGNITEDELKNAKQDAKMMLKNDNVDEKDIDNITIESLKEKFNSKNGHVDVNIEEISENDLAESLKDLKDVVENNNK